MASKRLTHTFVKNCTHPGRYGDGRGGLGLTLLVKRTSNGMWSKTFSQRLRINGAITSVGLGSFPVVTLAEAREKVLGQCPPGGPWRGHPKTTPHNPHGRRNVRGGYRGARPFMEEYKYQEKLVHFAEILRANCCHAHLRSDGRTCPRCARPPVA